MNISYVDPDIVSSVLADIDAEYGNISKMTTTQGNIHKYFGMTMDYSLISKEIFSVVNYILKMLTYIL